MLVFCYLLCDVFSEWKEAREVKQCVEWQVMTTKSNWQTRTQKTQMHINRQLVENYHYKFCLNFKIKICQSWNEIQKMEAIPRQFEWEEGKSTARKAEIIQSVSSTFKRSGVVASFCVEFYVISFYVLTAQRYYCTTVISSNESKLVLSNRNMKPKAFSHSPLLDQLL